MQALSSETPALLLSPLPKASLAGEAELSRWSLLAKSGGTLRPSIEMFQSFPQRGDVKLRQRSVGPEDTMREHSLASVSDGFGDPSQ